MIMLCMLRETFTHAFQDFAKDLRALFADVDALNMGPLLRPGADVQAAAASMAADAGVNNLMLRVSSSLARLVIAQHISDLTYVYICMYVFISVDRQASNSGQRFWRWC